MQRGRQQRTLTGQILGVDPCPPPMPAFPEVGRIHRPARLRTLLVADLPSLGRTFQDIASLGQPIRKQAPQAPMVRTLI